MMTSIDTLLNRITMYRLTLYYLCVLVIAAFVEGFFYLVPVSPFYFLAGLTFIVIVSFVSNIIFSKVFNAPTNVESVYITAFILALIIPPFKSFTDFRFVEFAFWAAMIATASKYILAIRKKHIFNPAAAALVAIAFTLGFAANWWVGTAGMLPFVLIGGFLIVRKTQRGDLALSFMLTALAIVLLFRVTSISGLFDYLRRIALDTPFFYFATVMLTEPLTTPPTRSLRIAYGIVVGLFFAPFIHIGPVYMTPELALVIGNVFSYAIGPKIKARLTLVKKTRLSDWMDDFEFSSDEKFPFTPGQYLEWTLAHAPSDDRGNRRYFTIASAPSEPNIHFGVKFSDKGSTFKRSLTALPIGGSIMASGLAGDFMLPKNVKENLVFIAGGIGVTPFRSMVKDMLLGGKRRDIVMLYSNQSSEGIAYKEIFDEASVKLSMPVFYLVTREEKQPGWPANMFAVKMTGDFIRQHVPDYLDRTFYISGTHEMVVGLEHDLRTIGVKKRRIKKDFFPGFV